MSFGPDQSSSTCLPSQATAARRGPDWQALPAETQQALTNLMVRLILEHARDGRPGPAEERGHD